MRTIYLDNNATTRPLPSVVEAVHEALTDLWANPSSIHRAGQRVRQRMELARESVAQLIEASPREIIFTSGGTESTNLAIVGSLHAQPAPARRVVVTDRLEHSATRDLASSLAERGVEIIWLPLDDRGRVDALALEQLLTQRAGEVAVVSVQWANNETGAVQPVREIGEACRRHGVRFHCDATQWVGKMPTSVADTPIDLMTFSAHKFHGPKGVGALYVRRKNPRVQLTAQLDGGGHERGMRSGTLNVPGIVGFGAAAALAQAEMEADMAKARALRDRLQKAIEAELDEVYINGTMEHRLPHNLNISFAYVEGESLLMGINDIAVSSGSACTSATLEPSYVLKALGAGDDLAHSSIRFGIGRFTTEEEIDYTAAKMIDVVKKLRELSPLYEMVKEGIDLTKVEWTAH